MMIEDVLTRFLIVLVILFLVPKILFKLWKIPYAITESFLGIGLGIFLPLFFYADDVISIFATLGIMLIFINGGMEVDLDSINRNKMRIFEIVLVQTIITIMMAFIMYFVLDFSKQVSLILALALATPSAGYAFTFLKNLSIKESDKSLIQGIVVSIEIINIILLLIFMNLDTLTNALLILGAVILIVALLPLALDFLYKKFFMKIIGTEFGFIFVVALLSAYATEMLGVHYIIGAFVAGIVSKKFLDRITQDKHITRWSHANITEGFTFFTVIFAPFYFFSVGLQLNLDILSWQAALIAVIACVLVSVIRMSILYLYNYKTLKEKKESSFNSAVITVPTLVFTFVIAEILKKNFEIGTLIYASLLIYGLLTSILPLFFIKRIENGPGIATS